MLWVLISRPRSHVLRVKTPVSGSRCLIHWLTHPDFRRKSCDKGLEAVTKQPRGATMMAMTYQDQVRNQHHPTLDSTSDLTHPEARGGRGLHGAYLGDAVGFRGGGGRVSKSVFDGECCGF